MGLDLDLTAAERTQLASLLVALGGESGSRLSLGELIRRWTEFVRAVEGGYDDSIYEYTNDLSVRDRLQAVVDGSSPTLRSKLASVIAPLDARFAAATEPAVRPLHANPGGQPSWWSRIPTRCGAELVADLESMKHGR